MGIEQGMGPDEKRLLDVLHGRGEVGKRLKNQMERHKKEIASYKIEVHFGKNRMPDRHTLNNGAVLIWESARRLHGGGDEKMYWCGYTTSQGFTGEEVCGMPIKSEFFAVASVVCPHCQRENYLSPEEKKEHILKARRRGLDDTGFRRMAIITGEKYFKMTNMNIAKMLYKYFCDLDRDADFYLKYHPSDIRCRDVAAVKKPDLYEKAREARRKDGLLIYPLNHFIRDTIAGADPVKRIFACITC